MYDKHFFVMLKYKNKLFTVSQRKDVTEEELISSI